MPPGPPPRSERSVRRLRPCEAGSAFALLATLACPVAADAPPGAAPPTGIVPGAESVTCVPGGVAAVPLERVGDAPLPARVPVMVGSLRSMAPVVWIGARADEGARFWTRSPEQVDAAMASELGRDPRLDPAGQLFAMVELPATGEGDLEVAGAAVRGRWLPAPQRLRSDAPLLAVSATASEDRPDPTTPVEYWRWSLLAERSGARIGDPRGDAADRLWARHVESLWAAGLERVRAHSRGMHAEVVDSLVGVAEDLEARRSVAAWVSRPRELRTLLGILSDTARNDAEAAQAALTWSRTRWLVTAWIEEDAGDRVLLAVANPSAGERVLTAEWVASDGQSPRSSILAKPRRVTRTWIDRPALPADAERLVSARERPEVLELSDGTMRSRLAAGAREYPVRPPERSFGTFLPPLSLADAQAGSIEPAPAAWATSAALRRRAGRWELFVDALRPADAPEPELDEVIVRLGDPTSPSQAFSVSASGALEMRIGGDDGVAAGFMRWGDRWRARIELPEAWLPDGAAGARPMMISIERVPGADVPRQTAALAMPPWRAQPPPVIVDLSAWGGEVR